MHAVIIFPSVKYRKKQIIVNINRPTCRFLFNYQVNLNLQQVLYSYVIFYAEVVLLIPPQNFATQPS